MIPNRFEWSEIFIVGLVGGMFAGLVALAIRLGAPIDSLLNFFGGAIGSGLAVVGALWVESHRRKRAFHQMLNSMSILASVAMEFKQADKSKIYPLIIVFEQSIGAFEASRSGLFVNDPIHQYALQSVIFWLKKNFDEILNLQSKHSAGNITDEFFIDRSAILADGIINSIKDYLNIPGIPRGLIKIFQQYENDKI